MNKERIAQFHKENILMVADDLFLRYGFEKTTVEMIAKESDYSKPTIYAYFKSKEEIFAYNLYANMERFYDVLRSRLAACSKASEAYLACCTQTVLLKRDYPVYFFGIMGSLDYDKGNLSEHLINSIRELAATINGMLKGLFYKGAEEGSIKSDIDVGFAYTYVWSCVFGLVNSPNLAPSKFESEEKYINTLEKCFLNVIGPYLVDKEEI